MRLRRTLGLSLKALLNHRTRAILALASVGAGVAAVVVTSAIGAGVERDVRRGIEAMGVNLLVVRPARVKRSVARPEIRGAVTSLRLADHQAIAALSLVADAAPGIEGAVRIKGGAATTTTRLLGTTAAYPRVRRFAVRSGRFWDAQDDRSARRIVVLGARVADALFEEDPVGRQIRIRGVPFTVVGVLAPKGMMAEGDEDNQVLVPVRTAQRRVFNVSWLNVVFVSARDAEGMAAAAAQIRASLTERHHAKSGGEPDFEVQNTTRLFAMQQAAASTLSGLTTGLAALALGVGGAGILALMLLSVKERTGEIGLRIAVGARPRDILIQFLLESTVLALGGWAAGAVVGAAGAALVALATTWRLAVPLEALAASFAMAALIGLGFGAVPARKAALVPPMRALLAA